MKTNIDKYKIDLEKLIKLGDSLLMSIKYECNPESVKEQIKEFIKKEKSTLTVDDFIKNIPSFKDKYQIWYTESLVLLKQLLPIRMDDFTCHYTKPKQRKDLTYSNYVIEDYLNKTVVRRNGEVYVSTNAAIPKFEQQLNIIKSISARFESSLFDIKQLVQADLFDSELDAAKELLKNKFHRAAGAMCGVVLEKHLAQVAENHNISISKKAPTINDFNEALKNNDIIDTANWRFIQHLGDIRNLCDHNKQKEPTSEQVNDLIEGVAKITKTLF